MRIAVLGLCAVLSCAHAGASRLTIPTSIVGAALQCRRAYRVCPELDTFTVEVRADGELLPATLAGERDIVLSNGRRIRGVTRGEAEQLAKDRGELDVLVIVLRWQGEDRVTADIRGEPVVGNGQLLCGGAIVTLTKRGYVWACE